DLFRAPPILQSEGWRVQPAWLFGFLNDPSDKLRPWLDVRMPTFPLGDERATKVVKGLSATADKPWPYVSVHPTKRAPAEMTEAKALFDNLPCVSCHIVGTMRPDQDPQSAAPNLVRAKTRLRPDWILAWLKNPQSLQDGTRMPSFFQADDMNAKPYPAFFGGDQARQIEALRDYVVSLGEPGRAASRSSEERSRRWTPPGFPWGAARSWRCWGSATSPPSPPSPCRAAAWWARAASGRSGPATRC